MSVEMKVPAVGEAITEVTIASWMKNDGDMVEMDEVICELEFGYKHFVASLLLNQNLSV